MTMIANRWAARMIAGASTFAVGMLLFGAAPAKAKQGKGANSSELQQSESTQKVDPKEQKAYKAFYQEMDADKKIQLGEDFLAKYPMSTYAQVVYNQLVNLYYKKQDWNKFYSTADQVVAKYPDDVDVLGLVGWVIPHVYDSNDPDAEKKLDKAETYEKHDLDVLNSIQKPSNMTDEQFATTKNEKLAQVHSALGLVYFRKGDGDDAVKELQQATQAESAGTGTADPTDYYVLGVELQRMNRPTDAADAFNKCAAIPGGLQDRCKQSATQALTLH